MTETDITPTVLLTGPTSGIGAGMLGELHAHPIRPKLVLMARDSEALATSLGRARDAGVEAQGIQLDLSDLASVRGALDELAANIDAGRIARPDVALLNAGAQYTNRRNVGTQGYELTFTVNVIAQHLMLRGLEPLLAPGGHTILMGSSTHRGKKQSFGLVPDPQWQEPFALATPDAEPLGTPTVERERGGVAYGTSKLATVTLAHDWAERLGRSGKRLNIYDPGLVAGTGLGRDLPGYMYWVWKRIMPAMRVLPGATSVPITARHAVALALGDAHPDLNDGYVEIGRLTSAEAVTFDPTRRGELWEWLESTVAEWLPQGVDAR